MCDSSRSSVPLTARKGPFIEEKSDKSPEISHLDPATWVLQGEKNAMKNLIHCDCGLDVMSDEVNVRFI